MVLIICIFQQLINDTSIFLHEQNLNKHIEVTLMMSPQKHLYYYYIRKWSYKSNSHIQPQYTYILYVYVNGNTRLPELSRVLIQVDAVQVLYIS